MPSYTKEVSLPGKSAQEIYAKVESDIDRFLGKTPIGKYELEKDAKKQTVTVKSSMFSGTLFCKDGKLSFDGKLSLLATPFKSKLDEGIDRWVSKSFA